MQPLVGVESIRERLLSRLFSYLIASSKCREAEFNFTRKFCMGIENYDETALFGM